MTVLVQNAKENKFLLQGIPCRGCMHLSQWRFRMACNVEKPVLSIPRGINSGNQMGIILNRSELHVDSSVPGKLYNIYRMSLMQAVNRWCHLHEVLVYGHQKDL